MGRLYVARRHGVQGFVKIIALKQILPHLADSAQLREMFLNEARIAARLEHPNIVATYELGEVEGKYFISMEYLPGEDLSAVITHCQGGQPVPIEIAATLSQQAASGLHYAHDARDGQGRLIGLVHRDVSPRNIFVTYHGAVKLLDFGMVRNPGGPKSVPGVFKGKFGYCAPEQLEGGRVDRRTDVFCLGIVLWESLTGARLFESGSDAATIDAVRSRRMEPPSALRSDVPRVLDEIALRALSRDPAQRYQSAQEMAEDLDRFLLNGSGRPRNKSVGQWLESIFGPERAALKKAISQGDEVEGALERLRTIDKGRVVGGEVDESTVGRAKVQPRALWSTSFGGPGSSHPSETSSPSPVLPAAPALRSAAHTSAHASRQMSGLSGTGSSPDDVRPTLPVPMPAPTLAPAARRSASTRVVMVTSLIAVVGLVVVGGVAWHGEKSPAPASARAVATLDVQSQPPGASIFVDGSPTGLSTPAVLNGLPAGRAVMVRLDKPGYQPMSQQANLEAGQTRSLSFTLSATSGTVRLTRMPAQATVRIDSESVDASKPLSVAAGRHTLRVEGERGVLLSTTIEVRAGSETTIKVAGERSAE
jgi:serine/threonine protein kinase